MDWSIGDIFGGLATTVIDTSGIEATLLAIALLFAGIVSFKYVPGGLLKLFVGFGLMGLAYFVYIGG